MAINPPLKQTRNLAKQRTYLQQVRRCATINRPRAATIELDETELGELGEDRGFARACVGCLNETRKVEVRVQLVWHGALSACRKGSVDICKDVCAFEELGPFQGRLVYRGKHKSVRTRGLDVESQIVTCLHRRR
jgi:hypothetical protein